MFTVVNSSEGERCCKATPEVPCRTQGFSQKRPAESNGTPAMDLGHMNVACEIRLEIITTA